MLVGSRLTLPEIDSKNPNVTLMGPWCLPLPSDPDSMQRADHLPMLDCPWKTPEALFQCCRDINSIYRDLLPGFAQLLNQTHRLQNSVRFWEILIGVWLHWIIHIIYDKYYRFLKAQEKKCGPLLGLSDNLLSIPTDTAIFTERIHHSEIYNWQILTKIAQLMEFPLIFSEKNDTDDFTSVFPPFYGRTTLKSKLYSVINKSLYRYGDTILYHTGHSQKFIFTLFLKSKCKIVEFPLMEPELSYLRADRKIRQKFREDGLVALSSKRVSTLNSIIIEIAFQHIPICFLEGFNNLKTISQKRFGSKVPKKIVSSIGWYFSETFKLWAASCSDKGTKLLGLQHGGNYGILRFLFSEKHETAITDKFFTWGWSQVSNPKVIPSPSPKLLYIKNNCSEKSASNEILYIGTASNRFLINFPDVSESFLKYFAYQVDFFSTLTPVVRGKLRVRLHYLDKIWEIQKRLSKKFEDLKFETWSIPFRKSMLNAKIIVCDHLSTTFIEILASNIPIILYWDSDITQLRESAIPYFNNLKKVGILHESGKSAAEFLIHQENSIHEWWYSADCQEAVKEFCARFAKQSSQPIQDWYDLLKD